MATQKTYFFMGRCWKHDEWELFHYLLYHCSWSFSIFYSFFFLNRFIEALFTYSKTHLISHTDLWLSRNTYTTATYALPQNFPHPKNFLMIFTVNLFSLPALNNQWYVFCLYNFIFSRMSFKKESEYVQPFEPGFFHLSTSIVTYIIKLSHFVIDY